MGGEISKTPQKAVPEPVAETVVPESVQVTDSEQTVTVTASELNHQQPEQYQTSPKQTTISTPTQTQPETQNSPQKAILESVVEK